LADVRALLVSERKKKRKEGSLVGCGCGAGWAG
jgi:hypothetical protein